MKSLALLVAVVALSAAQIPAQNPLSIFFDNFNAALGWTMSSPDWQIGPATASPLGTGNPDPSFDADGTPAGMLAGVVIGGTAPTAINGRQYITSPVIPSAGFPNLTLSYSRFLNSDYTPYMQNGIDVWDELSMSWVTIWTTGPSPAVFDAAWSTQLHDVSLYASNSLQVRFWYEVLQAGVFTISSWNIDNVDVFFPVAGGGQPSQPGVASLDVGGRALSPLGHPVSSGDNGIYYVNVAVGSQMSVDAIGSPNSPWVLLAGAANENATSIAPFGQIDLGTAGFGGLEVLGSGLDAGFINAFFHTNGNGEGNLSLTVPVGFTGLVIGLQGIMIDPVAIVIPTNAVSVRFI